MFDQASSGGSSYQHISNGAANRFVPLYRYECDADLNVMSSFCPSETNSERKGLPSSILTNMTTHVVGQTRYTQLHSCLNPQFMLYCHTGLLYSMRSTPRALCWRTALPRTATSTTPRPTVAAIVATTATAMVLLRGGRRRG